MSDKNRNMNDINDQKTAEQQAFSEEIRRRLAEPGSGKPTLDEFKVLVYKDREKRRKKRNALVACIVAAFIVGYLTYDDLVPEVGADKNLKETIQTEDGVIIEDGGWGSSTGEDDVWVVTEKGDIPLVKKGIPELVVPRYIPSNYEFIQLEVEMIDNSAITCKYTYEEKHSQQLKIEIHISNTSKNSHEVSKYEKVIKTNQGDVYICEEKNKIATMQIDDGIIVNVRANISNEEMIRVFDNLTY